MNEKEKMIIFDYFSQIEDAARSCRNSMGIRLNKKDILEEIALLAVRGQEYVLEKRLT